jgi:arginine deiminase
MKMPADKSADELADIARLEHNQFVTNLRDNGIRVTTFK